MNPFFRKARPVALTATMAVVVMAGWVPGGVAAADPRSETLDALLARVTPDVRHNLYDASAASPNGEKVTPATVPATADQPITIHGKATDVSIRLPGAAAVSDDSVAGKSVRVFDHGNGASSVPLVKDDGSVQILTVIDAARAPEKFRYVLDVPRGASVFVDEDGAVHITAADGTFIGGVAPAWAVDATGVAVPTRWEVAGVTLTQVIGHHAAEFAYPIVADPWLGLDLYNQPWLQLIYYDAYTINVVPTAWGVAWAGYATWWAHRDEVVTKLGSSAWRWTATIQEQFYCHIAGLPASLPEYNIESWRPFVSWPTSLLQYRCNP